MIALQEKELPLMKHVDRFINFRETVQEALNRRVAPADYVPDQDIPRVMKQAIVATEDKRFYDHGAIDFYGIVRALYTNILAGQTVEGGSTITQQLVKNLFLSSDRVWSRKAEELLIAFMMETYYTKEEILTMYLNSIYYGNDYTGIKEASEGYFKVEPKNLTIAQSAMLAGLPQAPTYYNPVKNPEAAQRRRAVVIHLMKEQRLITPQEAYDADKAPVINK